MVGRRLFALGLGLAFALLTSQADATPLISTQGGGQDYNILFNGGLPDSGTQLFGRTNGGTSVVGVSAATSLSVIGGHAGVTGSDSNLSSLTIHTNPGGVPGGFSAFGDVGSMVFSMMFSAAGSISIQVDDYDAQVLAVTSQGVHWFKILLESGFDTVQITANGNIVERLSHIRVSGVGPEGETPTVIPVDPPVTHSPEPASLALWSLALLGGAGYSWRRRRLANVA